jgi:hypothetical protein
MTAAAPNLLSAVLKWRRHAPRRGCRASLWHGSFQLREKFFQYGFGSPESLVGRTESSVGAPDTESEAFNMTPDASNL